MQFKTLQPYGGDQREVAEVVRNLMEGKSNNTGTVTLAVGGATTTTLSDHRIGYDSIVLLTPTTANASGYAYYITVTVKGSATITHAVNIVAGRTFKYIIVG
jgi:hypothetical protein